MKKVILTIFLMFLLGMTWAEIGNNGKTFGSCDTLRCIVDSGQAQYCCSSGRNKRFEIFSPKVNADSIE